MVTAKRKTASRRETVAEKKRAELRAIATKEQTRLERNRRARETRSIRNKKTKVNKIVKEYVTEAFDDIDEKMLRAAKKGKIYLSLINSYSESSNDPDFSGFSGTRTSEHEHFSRIVSALDKEAKKRNLKTEFKSLEPSGMFVDSITGYCIVW